MSANAISDLLGRIKTPPPLVFFSSILAGSTGQGTFTGWGGEGEGCVLVFPREAALQGSVVLDIPPNHPSVGVSLDEILLGATYSTLAK